MKQNNVILAKRALLMETGLFEKSENPARKNAVLNRDPDFLGLEIEISIDIKF